MNNKRKICVITGTRAEYGLLYWLIKEIEQDANLELQLVVTGMHLSPEFGLTFKQIEKDGLTINKKIEILLSSDTPVSISKSMGLAMISFSEAYEALCPDLIVVLGDRFEIFSAIAAATVARIPVAHLHGGEATEGLIDEPIRHSLTKMSHLHFTATETYKRRVIQLGEIPSRVFNVGAPGIDNIKRLNLLSQEALEKSIDFKFGKKTLMVTFHPVTLEKGTEYEQVQNLLTCLSELEDTHFIFTKANADTDGRIINEMIDAFVAENPEKSKAFFSLGQLRYLSTLQYVDGVIGNSSSGLIEVPSFKKGTINIGDRQRGRIKARSVIDCLPSKEDIRKALTILFSDAFQTSLKTLKNPYGEGKVAEKIVAIIKDYPLDGILKKSFYDLPINLIEGNP